MQNGFYEVRVPDATDYWIEMVKCRHACPVHTDACGYVTAIAEGRYETAYRIARAHQSVRFHLRAGLRRALRSQLPPRRRGCAGRHPPAQALRHRSVRPGNRRLRPAPRGQQRRACCRPTAAITSASRWSARAFPASPWRTTWCKIGYKVTVFEADAEPGGMLTVGVPGLPPAARAGAARDRRHSLAGRGAEVQHAAGPRFHHRQPARATATRPSSWASACPRAASCRCPARDAEGVIDGMDFLRAFNAGTPLPLGKRVVVIGGGNVAYDVARSAVRPARRAHGLRRGPFGAAPERRQGSPRGLPGKPRGDARRRDRSDGRRRGRHPPAQPARAARDPARRRQSHGPAHGALHRGLRRAAAASIPRSTKATSRTSRPTA